MLNFKSTNKKSLNVKRLWATSLVLVAGILGACGGGGSSSSTPASISPTQPGTGGTGWVAGQFKDASEFKNLCQTPRTGTDPSTGEVFPDKRGTLLDENNWLRSWSHDTYLWYNEITDQDPSLFSNKLTYFDELKTQATTVSGKQKDQFHFTMTTEEYNQRVSSGASAGYGARFALLSSSPPRDARVAYVEANSPASENSVLRGARILEVNGVSVRDGDAIALNRGMFPSEAGQSHSFLIQDVGSTATRTVTMTSAIVTSNPVNKTEIIETATGKVGYIAFNTFGTSIAEEQIFEAMQEMDNENVSDLVIDLRYNGGGFLAISSQLAYMVAGSNRTAGRTFDSLVFNAKHRVTNPVTGRTLRPTPFYRTGLGFSVAETQQLPSLDLDRVFILSGSGTCSASEALINGLRGVDVEVVLIGGTTCGKPYGFYATDNCGTTYFTIQFRGENDKGFGDYPDGFYPANATENFGVEVPGCEIADDFSKPLGDSTEGQLAAALQYRQDESCAAPSTRTIASRDLLFDQYQEDDLLSDQRVREQLLFETLRVENHPTAHKGAQ